MTEPIVISSLNDGINVKVNPSVIPEGGLADCVGFDLTIEGVLETAMGVAASDISALLPAVGSVQCMGKYYIGSTLYVMATTSSGLYANGVLVDAGFTGRFKAVSFLDNIYLVNGVVARRYDGTNCRRWGIAAPTSIPSFSANASYLSKSIDTFEDVTVWTANQVNCVVSSEVVIIKEGAASAQFTVAAGVTGYSYKPIPVDGTLFSNGEASITDDYIRFWMYVDTFANLAQLDLFIDIGDGTFADYFTYSIISSGLSQSMQIFGLGKTTEELLGEDSVVDELTRLTDEITARSATKKGYKAYLKELVGKSKTDVNSVLVEQVLSYWKTSNLFQLKDATWHEVKIPKKMFLQVGSTSLGWNTISSVKIKVIATKAGEVNVYFDDMAVIGGSDLVGDYWFMYAWGRTDASGNVVHESAPARDETTKQLLIAGPISFDRHALEYGTRPASPDGQVNCHIIYALGGTLTDFWEVAVIGDNGVAPGVLYHVGDNYATRKLTTIHNEPAPPGTDVTLFNNKIWMVGDPSYPGILRSSDILIDGMLAPEAWPPRNGYSMSENSGGLTNINVLNKQLVVKGDFGEWGVRVNDPVDYLEVSAARVSDKGLMAQDGVVTFEGSHVYPSNRGFVETDGSGAKFILPEIEPIIDSNIATAMGVNAGLMSYFSYTNSIYGNRTAKIDLYRGKPRFANLNNIKFAWLHFDAKNDKLYGVYNGVVYLLDSGYINATEASTELSLYLKSKAYNTGKIVAWTRMDFSHNTGGIWYRLDIYVDGTWMGSHTFKSTARTYSDFRFGPHSGLEFQFTITASYNVKGYVYLPMRIFHSG